MENYWSSLVWQNGGDISRADHKTSLVGSDQAAGGIQFLQDLIWKDKVMPDAADRRRDSATPSSRARPRWRPTARGSSRPTRPPGIDFGIAPLPKGPAGQATSINPTGAVVYKGTKNPDAAWEFVKYLASPAAQTKLMELKASLPANKEVLAGPFATSFDGAKVLADAIAYAHIKPSFKGYNELTTALQTELDANVFNDPNKTAKQAIDRGPAAARRDPRRPVTAAVDPSGRRDDAVVAAPPPRGGGGPLAGEGRWALLFLAPTLIGLAVLSAGPILATLGDQPDQVGPAHARRSSSASTTTSRSPRTTGSSRPSATRSSTRSCRCRSGW